jgi:hypothetical protein
MFNDTIKEHVMPPKELPKSIEALESIKVELESRAKGLKQVFHDGEEKFRIEFSAGRAMVPYSRLKTIRKNRKFGYYFKLSKRGEKAVESIESAIADLKAAEAKAAKSEAKKTTDAPDKK